MICQKCGFNNLDESTFCTECGYEFYDDKSVIKRRQNKPYHNPSPLLALIFSGLIPGAGQAYNKENKKALISFFSVTITLLLSIYFFGTYLHVIFFTIFSIIEIWVLSDSYFSACQIKYIILDQNYQKKIHRRIGIAFSAAIFLLFILFQLLFSTFILDSDVPLLELQKGDGILISNRYYFGHLPKIEDTVIVGSILGKIIEINPNEIKIKCVGGTVPRARANELLNDEKLAEREVLIPLEKFKKEARRLIYIYSPIEKRRKL